MVENILSRITNIFPPFRNMLDTIYSPRVAVLDKRRSPEKKNCFSFGFCPNYLQFGELLLYFSNVEIQELKVSLELKILYILYNILYICNPKNS